MKQCVITLNKEHIAHHNTKYLKQCHNKTVTTAALPASSKNCNAADLLNKCNRCYHERMSHVGNQGQSQHRGLPRKATGLLLLKSRIPFGQRLCCSCVTRARCTSQSQASPPWRAAHSPWKNACSQRSPAPPCEERHRSMLGSTQQVV